MSEKPNVSICIPTYNRKEYLKETLASVFTQTYKDFEVIVVDDGSTDGTEEMIKNSGYQVRYYWQRNRGEAAARNKMIGLSNGRFISFLDSDDLLMADALERMVRVMDSHTEDVIVYGPYLRIDQDGKILGRSKRKLYSGRVTEYLFQDILVHCCGSMFPKKVLEEASGFDDSLPVCSDYDLWLRLSLKYPFIALQGPTFKRRRHPGNLSHASSENALIELQVCESFYDQHGPDAVIPKIVAKRRLSGLYYRVGKYALREKSNKRAAYYFRQSLQHYFNLKAFFMWMLSSLKQKLA